MKTKNQDILPSANAPETEASFKNQRGRKTLEARLQEIIDRERELTSKRRALLAQQRGEARDRQTQLEAMIGAACRTDESIREFVQAALDKNVTDPRRRAFLKVEGWL